MGPAEIPQQPVLALKDTPARWDDFKLVTGPPTGSEQLPLKFHNHRWLQNVPVCQKAIELLVPLTKSVEAVTTKKCTDTKTVIQHSYWRNQRQTPACKTCCFPFNSQLLLWGAPKVIVGEILYCGKCGRVGHNWRLIMQRTFLWIKNLKRKLRPSTMSMFGLTIVCKERLCS